MATTGYGVMLIAETPCAGVTQVTGNMFKPRGGYVP